jgi:hypothetical protein
MECNPKIPTSESEPRVSLTRPTQPPWFFFLNPPLPLPRHLISRIRTNSVHRFRPNPTSRDRDRIAPEPIGNMVEKFKFSRTRSPFRLFDFVLRGNSGVFNPPFGFRRFADCVTSCFWRRKKYSGGHKSVWIPPPQLKNGEKNVSRKHQPFRLLLFASSRTRFDVFFTFFSLPSCPTVQLLAARVTKPWTAAKRHAIIVNSRRRFRSSPVQHVYESSLRLRTSACA